MFNASPLISNNYSAAQKIIPLSMRVAVILIVREKGNKSLIDCLPKTMTRECNAP
jgi:hypothetical protein